jgi:methylmalonyl-CoA/ethylmalonyl-CoA epimerase
MNGLSRHFINVNHIDQLGMVVRDIDKSMEQLWQLCGLGPWNVNMHNPALEVIYRGRPTKCGFLTAITQMGSMSIELIQPTQGESTYSEFLEKHGEGIHHIGWHVVDSLEALNDTRREFEKHGFLCVMSGQGSSGAFAYFDTTSVLNTMLEVIWRDPSKKRKPPYRVFPESK